MGIYDKLKDIDAKIHGPNITARDDQGGVDERAGTVLVYEAHKEADGRMPDTVFIGKVYDSDDDEDRGGVVIQITSNEDMMIPFARNIPNGIEIHFCGDTEAETCMELLVGLLSHSRYSEGRFLVECGRVVLKKLLEDRCKTY